MPVTIMPPHTSYATDTLDGDSSHHHYSINNLAYRNSNFLVSNINYDKDSDRDNSQVVDNYSVRTNQNNLQQQVKQSLRSLSLLVLELPKFNPKNSTSKDTAKKKKKVSFTSENYNQVHDIMNNAETEEQIDIAIIWYTEEEYKRIRKECRNIVDHHVNSLNEWEEGEKSKHKVAISAADENNDDTYDSLRGLEMQLEKRVTKYEKEYTPIRHRRRTHSLHSVLNEQYNQRMQGTKDDKLLADSYRPYSYDCRIEAEIRGLEDYRDVLLFEEE